MDRVSDGDRNAAVKAIEVALAEGRIVQADRDRRVDQAKHAQTASELQMITQDLAHRHGTPAWTTYEPPHVETQEAGTSSRPPVAYGLPQDQLVSAQVAQMYGTKRGGASKGLVLVPIFFLLVFAIVVGSVAVGMFSSVTDSTEGTETTFEGLGQVDEPDQGAQPDLFSRAGFQDLLAAVRTETGSTVVLTAVLYTDYAVTTVPAGATGDRAISYYFDGELSESNRSTETLERFDLATIDPRVLARLSRQAERLVENPASTYILVRRPLAGQQGWLRAYATNEFGESGYVTAEKDGTLVERSVSP